MQRQPTQTPANPGDDPAEGRSDMNLPGADQADQVDERRPGDAPDPAGLPRPDRRPPDGPDADRPQQLGERVEDGPGPGIRSGEPDLVPDVEVPEQTM